MGSCAVNTTGPATPKEWSTCRDERFGFSLRHPSDWISTTADERCVQLQKGQSQLPEGIPGVDVFIRVMPQQGEFPKDYLEDSPENPSAQINQGVKYSDREELLIGDLKAVRARFEAAGGPTPNWGIEYAIRKGDQVLDIYISQPSPDVEAVFEKVIETLEW